MRDPLKLYPDLLSADFSPRQLNPEFSAVNNAHGLYNTMQFVLRLSPKIHRILSGHSNGITTSSTIGFDGAQAMSTLIHETVHWWQHIGSTYGFMLSLNYPIQAHSTHFDLKKLAERDGFRKSVSAQADDLSLRGPAKYGTVAGTANTIVNNHYDLLAYRAFTLGPESAKRIAEQKLFENIGHAFHMTYAHTINQLASTVDKEFKAFNHPKEWTDNFRKLNRSKTQGYYYGSPIELWPIGSREIFEGQACFVQMQYLSHACNHQLGLNDFRSLGMLHGVYAQAFEEFLRLTESDPPCSVHDPLIGLFLLVCDLSINPGSGFPFSVAPNYESFIHDVNPGGRFVLFCRLIATKFPHFKNFIRNYSRTEYEEVTTRLCDIALEPSPLAISQIFSAWFSENGPLCTLLEEYKSYRFGPENFPLRYLLAHFLAFQRDKHKRPEVFCWPGAWMAGKRVDQNIVSLFEKHSALFCDKEEDDGVFPRLKSEHDEQLVMQAFNDFYHSTSIYDLTNQWICETGPFRYDIGWLVQSASRDEMKNFMRGNFKAAFQLDPEDVILIA